MSERVSASVRFGLAAYRVVARALPAGFRRGIFAEAYGDLERALRDVRRRRGRAAVARATLGAITDLVRRLPAEWRADRRTAKGRNGVPPRWTGESWMNRLNDVRIACRALLRRPGFAAVAVLTLALGIGANVAIFAVVDAVLLRPLPFPESEDIVSIRHHAPAIDLPELENSAGTVRFYRSEADFIASIAAYGQSARNFLAGGEPQRVRVTMASPEIFDVLRVVPRLGRPFLPEDAAEGAAPVAILTHGAWVERFGSDPAVIGQSLEFDGVATEIVGVMPEGFAFPDDEAFALQPMYLDPQGGMSSFGTRAVARLAPGVSLESAVARVGELQQRIPDFFESVQPGFLEALGWGVTLERLRDRMVGDVASTLWIVLGTVGLVLLIACVNVANLFLVRAESRQKELAVRSALGAGRLAIAGGFLTESFVLGIAGGVVGVLFAVGGVEALLRWGPQDLPRLHEIAVGGRVLGFGALLALASSLAFGALPAFRYVGGARAGALRDGGRGATDGRERHRLRNTLVAGQLALAVVLLVGAGLMARSFQRLRAVDTGVATRGVLTIGLSVGDTDGDARGVSEALTFYRQVADEVRSLPGVRWVGLTNALPLVGDSWAGGSFSIESRPTEEDALPPVAMRKLVTPGLMEALGMRVVRGRTMLPSDDEEAPVLWVNETFERQFLDGGAVGERISFGSEGDEEPAFSEIVGVVSDVREFGVREELRPVVYMPVLSPTDPASGLPRMYLVLRGDDDLTGLLPAIRERVRRLGPSVPLTSVRTMEDVVAETMRETSFTTAMLAIATTVAVFLGAIGLFGVVSYVVTQRTREIGVRVAMGANRGDIQRLVFGQAVGVAAAGVTLGLLGAFALTRVMGALLFGVSARDPATFAVAPAVLLVVATAATWLPARRAARVDPMEALRAR